MVKGRPHAGKPVRGHYRRCPVIPLKVTSILGSQHDDQKWFPMRPSLSVKRMDTCIWIRHTPGPSATASCVTVPSRRGYRP